MSLESKRTLLKAWIEAKYDDRKIRISGEPYFTHLLFVAGVAATAIPFGYEIGLCHDLLEDMRMPSKGFYNMLLRFAYPDTDAKFITDAVIELTDVYTAWAYPEMSKKERKKNEDDRISGISSTAQTVKYADLIYNIKWTLTYEAQKAGKYLEKKKLLMEKLTAGDQHLRRKVNEAISAGLFQLH